MQNPHVIQYFETSIAHKPLQSLSEKVSKNTLVKSQNKREMNRRHQFN